MPRAVARNFPTDIFSRLWWEQLRSHTTRPLVFGLIADADDMGRGEYSHSRIANATGIPAPQVKAAIKELEKAGIVLIYQVANKSYYYLTQWNRWEHLRSPRPSEFPAPPASTSINTSATHAPEGEGEKRKESESELPSRSRKGDDSSFYSEGLGKIDDLLEKVARVLQVEVTPALKRIIREFGDNHRIDLVAQAELARDWIDNNQEHKKKTKMSATFFQRWVERAIKHLPEETVYDQNSAAIEAAIAEIERRSVTYDDRSSSTIPGMQA